MELRHLRYFVALAEERHFGRAAARLHGFVPFAAHEVAETGTLVSFAAGLGVSLVPDSVRNMSVRGAVYRPLARDTTRVELAAAWRSADDRPVLARALDVMRREVT